MPVSSVSFPTTGKIKENSICISDSFTNFLSAMKSLLIVLGLLEKARVDDNLRGHTTLYAREFFDPAELNADNAKVGSLWVRIRGRPTRQINWQESVTDHPARKK